WIEVQEQQKGTDGKDAGLAKGLPHLACRAGPGRGVWCFAVSTDWRCGKAKVRRRRRITYQQPDGEKAHAAGQPGNEKAQLLHAPLTEGTADNAGQDAGSV